MEYGVSARLKQARIAKGLTLKELGKLVGISESVAQKYENGNIKGLRMDRVVGFADALNVSAEWIMGWNVESKKYLEVSELDDDEIAEVKEFIEFVKHKRR